MSKQIIDSNKSKEIALETIVEIAGAVKRTLGPAGNPIIIQRQGTNPDGTARSPLITKDGYTVAESISFKDPAKDTFAKAIIQVAQNTVNQVGDGTSSATVIAEALYVAGFKHLSQGVNGIQLYEELKRIKNDVLDYIDAIKIEVTAERLLEVAKISCNGDEEIAQIVVDAIEAVGDSGHIALEEGLSSLTELLIVEGAFYRQGWKNFSPFGSHLVTDKARNVCELNNPAILLYAGKLDSQDDLTEFLFKVCGKTEQGGFARPEPTLIVANDYSDEIKNYIVQLRVHAKLPIAAIKSPADGTPNNRTESLEDIAALTGATVSSKGILELKDVTLDHLGLAEKVEISAEETVFFKGAGDKSEILDRVSDLKKLLETRMSDFDKGNIRVRIGKLTGGIAIIQAGGNSELEMLEKKDRIEDALCATRTAVADGIVAGGGFALYHYASIMAAETIAQKIMKEALVAPTRQIITNAGLSADVILSHLENKVGIHDQNGGYDSRNKVYVNLMEVGILDPAKVVKAAIENAVSIAGLLLTCGGAVTMDSGRGLQDGQSNPFAAMFNGGQS